ncbi:MAG TPA: hypothetical protein VL551_28165 [Actinospica sp.]|jgi:hypothetical protein|nr:hypothetical protein [Actinospica sp.]
MSERPQRPVSPDTQRKIAEGIDADAQWAEDHGYPSTAATYRERAAQYRAATGQTASGEASS